jgi:EAL domain-containing protein (putative c-di-GMP-specific phosphodiesterase class I)
MREPFGIDSQYHQISLSIGVAMFDGPETGADELLKRADIAMYEAKAGGRNALRFFDREIAVQLGQRVALEADLQQALAAQQFRVYYQPQYDSGGRLVGAEALLRWSHPGRGLVSPGQFIPLAEETGLILPLGQWVLEQVSQQIRSWQDHPVLGSLVVSVNLCAHQLLQANFVESVTAVLMATGADPRKLQLELTESVLARNIDDASGKMKRLVDLGVQFSLDDFGTGYSSLSYLKRLPIQQLKIDASFVRDIEHDPNDVAIAQTVIDLGRSLGLEVIAEGVETAAQRDILLRQGCRLFQGYLYARPQALADFVDLVLKNNTPAATSQESPP